MLPVGDVVHDACQVRDDVVHVPCRRRRNRSTGQVVVGQVGDAESRRLIGRTEVDRHGRENSGSNNPVGTADADDVALCG